MRSFLIENDRPNSVKCSEDQGCSLVYFEMEGFKKILHKFPKDYERYCELKDDILMNSNTLDLRCNSCYRYDHTFSCCPLITMHMPPSLFIAKFLNKGEPNVRESC